MLSKEKIAWEVKEHIGFITFVDEPENRMDIRFFNELQVLTSQEIPVAGVKAIIISGKGRHFSSGANLDELQHLIKEKQNGNDFLIHNSRAFKYFEKLNIPVIMAIRGVCLGAGLELALHGHFRLCSEEAIFGLPESTFGLMPGAGGIHKMIDLAGKAKAMELILRGNRFTAGEALEWHVVDAVIPRKELMQKAIEMATLAAEDYRVYNKMEYLKKVAF